jgi:hypothetical protein
MEWNSGLPAIRRRSCAEACVSFDAWVGAREIENLGSNIESGELPFQSWRNFKEAFAPEVVARAIIETKRPVRRLLDPFGGSGTTSLASQFLGVTPGLPLCGGPPSKLESGGYGRPAGLTEA